jgi:uncharacterized protein (TIGR03118 family)
MNNSLSIKNIVVISSLCCILSACGGEEKSELKNLIQNSAELPAISSKYTLKILVANKIKYKPSILDEKLKNAWGIAIRPAGLGGHFWVTGKDISFEYVGDVKQSTDIKLQNIYADNLPYVKLNVSDNANSTGVAFNGGSSFIITQNILAQNNVTAPAKFVFAADDGTIHAWTEKKIIHPDGSTILEFPTQAIKLIDNNTIGAQYFGVAFNQSYTKLYAANFGKNAGIDVFDAQFKPINMHFDMPFDDNKNNKVDAGEYAPFNIQNIQDATSSGNNHLLVTYAKTQVCNQESIKNNICKEGEIEYGEEMSGSGRIAEFDENGRLLYIWDSQGLDSPWGLAYAPSNFGQFSYALLVGNFGSDLISAYHPKTHQFIGYLSDNNKQKLKINGIWGLQFGNGASLGDKNTLYFAAGPQDENDGVFGSIRLD